MQEGEAVGGEQGQQLIEEASPISSRPPASASVNLDEFMGLSDGGEPGPGVGGGGGSSGNRWPRQETLALLKIRSDMDASFRDATLKGPLWEDVSRKLTELGYKRSAKKCKEKFENVHKYYKRTKEGRAGRQDGKSYKFFTQLEALHGATTQTANQFVAAVNPMPISSFRVSPSISTTPSKLPSTSTSMPMFPPPDITKPVTHANTTASTASIFPARVISFSSNSSSSSPSSQDDDDDEDDDLEGEPSTISRKRKRESWKESSHRMMEFFENLMKQVMQKQEAMQQKFLEIIEEREKDRMIREEAWKRQEMARLSRENELMTQERAMSASRDAAIISFLQKITGQTIQLPPPAGNNIHHPAPPASAPPPRPAVVPSLTRQQQLQQQKDQQRHKHQSQCTQKRQQPSAYTDQIAVAVNAEQHATPQLEFAGGPGIDTITTTLEATSSSRWPKAEVVALINLRSGLESRYQEAGPKGPLWEEISAGMQRMGYKRSAKRCKEKWENINKYFKKIKESNNKRPDVSKTCPYFHQLDALYLKKVNTIGSSSAHAGGQHSTSAAKQSLDKGDAETSIAAPNQQPMVVRESENKTAATTDRLEITSSLGLPSSFYGEGTVVQGASEKPEDIVKELMEQQENHRQQPPVQHLIVEDYDKTEEPYEDIEQEDEDEDEDDNEELEDHGRKMAYKIELIERQKATGTSATGGGNGVPSFLAMVQ